LGFLVPFESVATGCSVSVVVTTYNFKTCFREVDMLKEVARIGKDWVLFDCSERMTASSRFLLYDRHARKGFEGATKAEVFVEALKFYKHEYVRGAA